MAGKQAIAVDARLVRLVRSGRLRAALQHVHSAIHEGRDGHADDGRLGPGRDQAAAHPRPLELSVPLR